MTHVDLQRARIAKGLTQAMLAEELGVSLHTIWTWEAGVRTPSPQHIPELANRLGLDANELAAWVMDRRADRKGAA